MKEFLKKIPMFSNLSDEDLSFLDSKVQSVSYNPNELVFNEGESGSSAFVIKEGEIEIFKKSNKRDILLAIRSAGELVGELSILENAIRSTSARAKTHSELLLIDGKDFNDLLDHSLTASRSVFHSFMSRWRSMESMMRQSEKMAMLGTLTAGIAHELMNPVSAVKSSSERLKGEITSFIEAQKEINLSNLTKGQLDRIYDFRGQLIERALVPLELDPGLRNDREYEMETWLENQGIENSYALAPTLVNLDLTINALLEVMQTFGKENFNSVVNWLSHTSSVYTMLTEIGSASEKMSEIVKGLKEYSYLDQAPIQILQLHKGIDMTLVLLKSKVKAKTVKITRDYDDSIPDINGYGNELNQVWTNLLDNALDAVPDKGGEIKIKTKNLGEWVSIEFQDNGTGIPEGVKHKIFDPFFTTKPPGKGTGLGLDITYRIITQKHNGDIQFYSQPGFTNFQIMLPMNLEDVVKNKILVPSNILPVNEYFTRIVNDTKSLAVIYVSTIKEQPNYYIPEFFLEKGFEVFLVHPTLTSWNNKKVYKHLNKIEQPIDLILLFESNDIAVNTVEEAIVKKVKTVWMQEGVINVEAADTARAEQIDVVMDMCFYTTFKRIYQYRNS